MPGPDRQRARIPGRARAQLVRLLRDVRYELLPLGDALVQSAYLPAGSQVAVTADAALGMWPTIELSVELSRRGFRVTPHLAAQLIADRGELERLISRLGSAGVDRALVVGGVADSSGVFADSGSLIDAIAEVGTSLRAIGIAGYPEGHHTIPDEPIERSLLEKASRSDWVTSQICLNPDRVADWIGKSRAAGLNLPIWLGIPAVADLTGLMSLGMRVGAGRSLQFMFEHPRIVTRLLRPGGRKASELVLQLGEVAADEAMGIEGFHLFTYNQVRAAERWRERLMERLH